jgi:hypothetical protein
VTTSPRFTLKTALGHWFISWNSGSALRAELYGASTLSGPAPAARATSSMPRDAHTTLQPCSPQAALYRACVTRASKREP